MSDIAIFYLIFTAIVMTGSCLVEWIHRDKRIDDYLAIIVGAILVFLCGVGIYLHLSPPLQ